MFAIPSDGDVYGPFDAWGEKLLIRASEAHSIGFEELLERYFNYILHCPKVTLLGALLRVRRIKGFIIVCEGILCSMVPSKASAVDCFGESMRALVQNAHRLESILSGCERCVGLTPGEFISSSLDGDLGDLRLREFLGFQVGNWARPWEGSGKSVKGDGVSRRVVKPVKSVRGSSGFLGGNRVDVVGVSDMVGEAVERLRRDRGRG